MNADAYQIIVVGASFGGIDALNTLIPKLSRLTNMPMVIVQHIKASENSYLAKHLDMCCEHTVKEAEERERLCEKTVYVAPGGYHLYIEKEQCFSLSMDHAVQFSRPSIDVLFESVAGVYGKNVIGILLTGSNNDGALGMSVIHQCGGLTIVQDPKTAIMPTMPQAAIDLCDVDYVEVLDKIPACVEAILAGNDYEHGK